MKAILITVLLLLASAQASAALAIWTGQIQYVTTVSGKMGINCQYQAPGGTFWMTFKLGNCPSSVDVD